jgi:excisionase family DNA binding protein
VSVGMQISDCQYGVIAEMNAAISPLLDARQAAKILRCHEKTVQKLAREKVIPAIQYGRRWFFDEEALALWLRSRLTISSQPLS